MTPMTVRPITLSYPAKSAVESGPQGSQISISLDGARGPVGVRGVVRDAGLLRDALMTAATVFGSDLRHKSKDRTAYLAYLAKQGKKATAAIWEAQKAFLDQAFSEDREKITTLDPVLTVHPDEVSIEVFSRDQSAYARLALGSDLLGERQAAHGTTFADLGPSFIEGLDRLRTYTRVALAAESAHAHAHAQAMAPTAEQRALEVPYAYLRGFLQVQSAATLPSATCELLPIDLYNILFALRTRKAKKPPRALRFELVPGSAPRIVLEPWEIVLEGHGEPYRGKAPRVVRTFGRQRLLSLARMLPYLKSARVHLIGPGLPVFWVLDAGAAVLTLALSGWSESGWSSAASFDALTPGAGAADLAAAAAGLLRARGPLSVKELLAATGDKVERVQAAMQLLCLRGQALYDLGRGVYRPRDLLGQPVDEALIRYGNVREEQAHRLLGDGKAAAGEVKLTKIHEIVGEGLEIQGEITDREARRSYHVGFTLDTEGRARDASCGCPTFRRSGMREGPCEHLLALRLAYGRQRAAEEARRQTPEGRRLIRAETRTLSRREQGGEELVYRVSLDDRTVRLIWGARAGAQRQQRLWFDTDREAREAYFGRLDALAGEGFIDADAF